MSGPRERAGRHLLCFCVSNLGRLPAPPGSSGIGHQLRMAALLQAHEPEDSLVNCLAAGKEAMVLQECSFVVAERFCDVLAFLFCQDDSIEALVKHVVLFQVNCPVGEPATNVYLHCGMRTSLA
jgi:hypothetical protein